MYSTSHDKPDVFELILRHWKPIQFVAVPSLVVAVAAVYGLVYFTGGVKYVYSHSMYLVILCGGFIFGMPGGVLTGLIAGLVLGPFMPLDVATGEPQGTLNWLYRTGFFLAAGLFSGVVSHSIQRYLRRIRWYLRHDPQSGLANRFALIERLRWMDGNPERPDYILLAVVSLENAEEIEEIYDQGVTSEIICQLGSRMAKINDCNVRSYRISPHHLAALVSRNDSAISDTDLEVLIGECSEPFAFGGLRIHGDIRIGYTVLGRLEKASNQLLRQAELALRKAARQHCRTLRFRPDMSPRNAHENLELLGELKSALAEGQLSLHYQPKVDSLTGKVKGVEALMRWHHPVRGYIPPDMFIPRAENSTLIQDLTDWAIDTALAQLVRWNRSGLDLDMAVNISSQNLLQPDFVESVLGLVNKHQIDARRLELEVTEGAFMLELQQSVEKLNLLANAGIIISIDDFGTGYSSLQYLNQLPIAVIKIDQYFIKTLKDKPGSAPIVKAIINTAHELGLVTVAEGVEDVQSYSYLRKLECDMIQGYLVSRPMPSAEFDVWYQRSSGVFNVRTVLKNENG